MLSESMGTRALLFCARRLLNLCCCRSCCWLVQCSVFSVQGEKVNVGCCLVSLLKRLSSFGSSPSSCGSVQSQLCNHSLCECASKNSLTRASLCGHTHTHSGVHLRAHVCARNQSARGARSLASPSAQCTCVPMSGSRVCTVRARIQFWLWLLSSLLLLSSMHISLEFAKNCAS